MTSNVMHWSQVSESVLLYPLSYIQGLTIVVFLRILEYYKGILILTTNRVGAFDDAFHSRIHLSLYYPALDRKKTIEVFKKHFQRIDKHNEERVEKHDAPIETEKDLIQKYWERNYKILKWNGRQIRNAFQTAMALAEYDAQSFKKPPMITVKHFETIAKASVDFARYVTEVQGAEPDQVALREKNRLDHEPKTNSKLRKLRSWTSSSSDSESDSSQSESSSSEDSDDVDDKKKRKKSKKKKGRSRQDTKGKIDKKGKTHRKGKKDSASRRGDGRGSKASSSDSDDDD